MRKKKVVAIIIFLAVITISICSFAYYNARNYETRNSENAKVETSTSQKKEEGRISGTRTETQVNNTNNENNNRENITNRQNITRPNNNNNESISTTNLTQINIENNRLRDIIEKIFDFFFGDRKEQRISEEILKDNNVKFESKTFTYDTTVHTLQVENLPDWATVEYENNELTDVGKVEVKAKITPKKNSGYKGSITLIAEMEVEKKTLEEEDLANLNVKFEDKTFEYNGKSHDLRVENLPNWATVEYVNNTKVNVQTAIVTAKITAKEDSNYEGTVKLRATLIIQDTTAPKITLNGEKTITLEAGSEYVEQGATVNDNADEKNIGPIAIRYYANPSDTSKQEILSSVDTHRIGVYKLIYIYKDSLKNQAVDSEDETKDFVMRTIIIQDTTLPELTLNGEATIELEVGSEYIEQGVTVTDNYDETKTNMGPIAIKYYADPSNTARQELVSKVDTNCVGVYKLIYIYKDSFKNQGVDANDHSKDFVMRTIIIK